MLKIVSSRFCAFRPRRRVSAAPSIAETRKNAHPKNTKIEKDAELLPAPQRSLHPQTPPAQVAARHVPPDALSTPSRYNRIAICTPCVRALCRFPGARLPGTSSTPQASISHRRTREAQVSVPKPHGRRSWTKHKRRQRNHRAGAAGEVERHATLTQPLSKRRREPTSDVKEQVRPRPPSLFLSLRCVEIRDQCAGPRLNLPFRGRGVRSLLFRDGGCLPGTSMMGNASGFLWNATHLPPLAAFRPHLL